jgi:hypothetical protein
MSATDGQPAKGRSVGRRVAVVAGLLLLLPVGLAVGVFPFLTDQPFDAVTDIRPADVQSVRVWMLNRTELDGGPDVGPFLAAREDWPALLAPLTGARDVSESNFPDARGPWLGEYRIRTVTGRRGTVRLYWTRRPVEMADLAAVGAVGGGPAFDQSIRRVELRPTEVRLRFQIGDKWYDGGSAHTLIAAVEAAAPRGVPVPLR